MAILDAGLLLSDAQAVTSTAASTNVIDLTATAPNLGRGAEQLYVQVAVNTTATASGSATLDLALQDSADNSSFAAIHQVPQFAVASLTAGTILMTIAIPPTCRRYLRVYYTIGTGPLTAGKFDAFVSTGPNK